MGRTRAKWQCVATRGQGGHSSTATSCGHHVWLAPCSRCWGVPLGTNWCGHVVIPRIGPTRGAHQGQVAVCGHQGAGVRRRTGGYCGHHGRLAPSSGCWGDPVGPKGWSQIELHLLSATSSAHQAKMAVCGHQVAKNWVSCVLFLRLFWEWSLQPSDIIPNIV